MGKLFISQIFTWYDHHRRLTHLSLMVLVGMIVYSGTLHAPFYFDDQACIVENPLIRNFSSLFNLESYREFGIPEDIRNNMVTRFVAYFTFALNYRLHELSLPGYHLLNIFIHLLNAALVYELFSLAAKHCTTTSEHGRNQEIFALLAALIFVVHPVQTNAVTYIVQRFSLLATFFYLTALIAYIKAATATTPSRRRLAYSISITATILAMYTKEISFTLPVMIALYDIAFLDGNRRTRLRRLTPILATLVLIPVTVIILSFFSANTGSSVGNPLDLATLSENSVSRWEYFITQWRVIITYLRLLLLPIHLNIDYDYPVYSRLFQPEVLLSGLGVLVLSLTSGYLLFCKRCGKSIDPALRLAGFGLVWFFLTLVMESSIIRLDDIIFEYRLYLPAVGFCGAAVALGDWGLRRIRSSFPQRGRRTATILISIALIGSLGVATIMRNNVWNNATLLWEDTVAKSPKKSRPLGNLANEYAMQGRFEEALPLFKKAKALAPDSWIPPFQLGQIYLVFNQPAAAVDELLWAVKINSAQYQIWFALGYAYLQLGMVQKAADAYQRGLVLNPGDQSARQELDGLQKRGVAPTGFLRY